MHGLRRVADAEVRRRRGEARVAPLEGLPGGDAGRRTVLQAQDGRVLGGLANARPRRRAPPRALRRRDLGRERPRRAHMLQQRETGLLVHGKVGELEGMVGPHVADPGARGGRHRRREQVRQGRARDLTAHQGPEMHLPRLLAGQALHHDAAEAPGGARPYLIARDLMGIETLRQAELWVERYLDWCGFWADFPDDGTMVEGGRACTHERLRRARSSLSSLVSAGTLFTYLDPALARAGPLPSANNMIEEGVNSQLRAVLRNHRGPDVGQAR